MTCCQFTFSPNLINLTSLTGYSVRWIMTGKLVFTTVTSHSTLKACPWQILGNVMKNIKFQFSTMERINVIICTQLSINRIAINISSAWLRIMFGYLSKRDAITFILEMIWRFSIAGMAVSVLICVILSLRYL